LNIGFIEDTHLRGGSQIWVMEANRYFLEQGETVTVLAPEGSWVANECRKDGAQVVTYDYDQIVSKGESAKNIWAKALCTCDVAICTVHPPRNSFHCAMFAGECIKEYGLNTVLITKTGTIVPEYLREFYLPEESIYSTVIAITDFTRQYLLDTYKIPIEKTDLIYQGTEVELFTTDPARKAEAYKRYQIPEHSIPVLGCVGTLEERKGQIVLLDSIAQLVQGTLPDVHLILVGEGPDEHMLEGKVHTMGLDKHVSFFPFTREPIFVFERIDALILPSLYKEGLPNVLLEAMSMKIPVISSRLAGVPEIIEDGETGYMVEPGDSKLLATVIAKLWADKDTYNKIRENGRELMLQKFDKQTQYGEFLAYFRRVGQK